MKISSLTVSVFFLCFQSLSKFLAIVICLKWQMYGAIKPIMQMIHEKHLEKLRALPLPTKTSTTATFQSIWSFGKTIWSKSTLIKCLFIRLQYEINNYEKRKLSYMHDWDLFYHWKKSIFFKVMIQTSRRSTQVF